jgi:hypothetical protein
MVNVKDSIDFYIQSSLLASQQQQQHICMEKQIDPETTGKPAGICLLRTDLDVFKKVAFFMTFSLFEKEKPFQLITLYQEKKNLY